MTKGQAFVSFWTNWNHVKVKKVYLALAFVSLIATGCNSKLQKSYKVNCGKGSIEKFLKDGWKVVSTNEREVKCGSRSEVTGYREIVYGSQITQQPIGYQEIPIMGTEVEYILEK